MKIVEIDIGKVKYDMSNFQRVDYFVELELKENLKNLDYDVDLGYEMYFHEVFC